MKMPEPGSTLCTLEEIPDPGAIGIELENASDIIIIRQGAALCAYINSCPHQGTPLETLPNRFLTRDKKYLLCTTHGAWFRIEDGICVHGPCKGDALRSIRVKLLGGIIVTI